MEVGSTLYMVPPFMCTNFILGELDIEYFLSLTQEILGTFWHIHVSYGLSSLFCKWWLTVDTESILDHVRNEKVKQSLL